MAKTVEKCGASVAAAHMMQWLLGMLTNTMAPSPGRAAGSLVNTYSLSDERKPQYPGVVGTCQQWEQT